MKNSSSDKPAAELKLWYCKTYGTERSYGGNDGYEDTLESKYAYHQFVKNSRRIEPGDVLLLCDRSDVLGMGCVQRIERSRATILRRRCPVCGETDIDERKKLTPKWRCRHAHQFETPTEEMIECWQYSALYPDTYVKLNGEITLSEVLKTRQKAAAIDSIVRLEGREIISRLSGLLSEITVDPAAVELSSAGSLANKGHNTREFLQEVEEEEFPEGALLYRAHITRERNTRLLRCAKLRAKLLHGHLCCEACGFDFFEMYGEVGEDYIECHHTVPVSDLTPQSRTQIRDIALLCANCHRIVHRRRPWLTLNELKRLILLRNDGRS